MIKIFINVIMKKLQYKLISDSLGYEEVKSHYRMLVERIFGGNEGDIGQSKKEKM